MQSNIKIKAKIMDEENMMRVLRRLAHEIIEKNRGLEDIVIVGILTRGAVMANLLQKGLYEVEGVRVPVGSIDITYYRDDLSRKSVQPVLNGTHIPFDINNKNVILVDDVIYTGRTVRAAIDGIFRLGRPAKVQLAVMIDRGLRELPFKPDFIGKNIPTSHSEVVEVKFKEIDGESCINIFEKAKQENQQKQ